MMFNILSTLLIILFFRDFGSERMFGARAAGGTGRRSKQLITLFREQILKYCQVQ